MDSINHILHKVLRGREVFNCCSSTLIYNRLETLVAIASTDFSGTSSSSTFSKASIFLKDSSGLQEEEDTCLHRNTPEPIGWGAKDVFFLSSKKTCLWWNLRIRKPASKLDSVWSLIWWRTTVTELEVLLQNHFGERFLLVKLRRQAISTGKFCRKK